MELFISGSLFSFQAAGWRPPEWQNNGDAALDVGYCKMWAKVNVKLSEVCVNVLFLYLRDQQNQKYL